MLIVLLPFAVQLAHSFEHHEHYCNVKETHIGSHEIDCDVFHFKINQNSIDFPLTPILKKEDLILKQNNTTESTFISVKLHYKSSRAPPFLLFLS